MANLTLRTLTRSGDTTKGTPLTNAEVDTNFINLDADIESKAPLASPTFTGTPLAPTATSGTNNTQIATTAFVNTAIGSISVSNITSGTLAVSRGGTGAETFTSGGLLIGNGTSAIGIATANQIVTAIGDAEVNKVHINSDPDDAVNYSVLIDGQNGVSVSKVAISADTGRLIAPSFQGSIAASNINSGTIGTARLGSGTASASTYLRGDQTWASIPGGGIGTGQTWQSVTRYGATWYQNTTGKPIGISIKWSTSGSSNLRVGVSQTEYVTIDQNDGDSGEWKHLTTIIPDQHWYYSPNGSFLQFLELR